MVGGCRVEVRESVCEYVGVLNREACVRWFCYASALFKLKSDSVESQYKGEHSLDDARPVFTHSKGHCNSALPLLLASSRALSGKEKTVAWYSVVARCGGAVLRTTLQEQNELFLFSVASTQGMPW